MLLGMAAEPTDVDPRNLHDLALDVHTDLQKLATGLAHAGVSPHAVAQLTGMAQIIGQVVKQLAAGPDLSQQSQGQQPQGAPAQPPAPAAPPAQAAPSAAPPGPAPPEQVHHTMHAAAHALHADMIASAQKRQAAGK